MSATAAAALVRWLDGRGVESAEIAALMGVSERTVRRYRSGGSECEIDRQCARLQVAVTCRPRVGWSVQRVGD